MVGLGLVLGLVDRIRVRVKLRISYNSASNNFWLESYRHELVYGLEKTFPSICNMPQFRVTVSVRICIFFTYPNVNLPSFQILFVYSVK